MMKNNKGFTVIELVMSFLFVSIICLSMYSLIVNYKDRSMLETIKSELKSLQTSLTLDIQKDIERKLLNEIKSCPGHENANNCVEFFFKDDTTKRLEINEEVFADIIEGDTLTYKINYIMYGGIKYSIPDAKYVNIQDDLILMATTNEDDLETKNTLYRIKIGLKHQDVENPYVIRITTAGNKTAYTGAGSYTSYSIGASVTAKVSAGLNIPFIVIRDSSSHNSHVTLLYNGDYSSHGLGTSQKFNLTTSSGNKYDTSIIRDVLLSTTGTWINPKEIRLMTAEEIAFIINSCPNNKKSGADMPLTSSGKTWLYNKDYWTMTSVEGDNTQAWYVTTGGSLTKDAVNIQHFIRPVIVIHKSFLI
jgi:Tfp pilus assembly protein PilE